MQDWMVQTSCMGFQQLVLVLIHRQGLSTVILHQRRLILRYSRKNICRIDLCTRKHFTTFHSVHRFVDVVIRIQYERLPETSTKRSSVKFAVVVSVGKYVSVGQLFPLFLGDGFDWSFKSFLPIGEWNTTFFKPLQRILAHEKENDGVRFSVGEEVSISTTLE